MYQRSDIKEGMTVRSADGHKLGKVYAVGDSEFHIEKGLFFPKDYAVRYVEISELRHGEIVLAHGKESLRSIPDEVPYGSDTIATREGIGTSRVIPAAEEVNAGERTGLPFGARPEELRTQDLGAQPIGPYNTEGARASPFLTEEDRARSATGIGTSPAERQDIRTTPVTATGIGTSPIERQGIGTSPVETQGIGTSPVDTEDRGVEVPIRRERVRTTRRDMVDRPALSASPDEPVGTPLRAEELEARRRTMVGDETEEEHLRVTETRGDTSVEGTRSLDFSSDDPNKRGR